MTVMCKRDTSSRLPSVTLPLPVAGELRPETWQRQDLKDGGADVQPGSQEN